MTIPQRLSSLRAAMLDNGLDAYIIPSNDAHQSEYVADHWNIREWISGFTGSAGLVVVTDSYAGLWTDNRYFLQAEKELKDTGISLHKPEDRFAPEHIQWLAENLTAGSTVGMDGDLCTVDQRKRYQKILAKNKLTLDLSQDLFDVVWSDRRTIPSRQIFAHELTYAGRSRSAKLSDIRAQMTEVGVQYHLITTLDDIAWIFNIRGSDVDFNPVAICYALIGIDAAILFIDANKVPNDLAIRLADDGVIMMPYGETVEHLAGIPRASRILIDQSTTNVTIADAISADIVDGKTISTLMKGIKNEIEVQHTRDAMAKDGAAIANTFYWLEQSLKTGEAITEADVADRLALERSKMELYMGESFPAIVGYKDNGAVIHYRPIQGSCNTLKPEGILLVDSGGQYLDGTTDITRTIALGQPSKEEKRNFTLVLKGNISLSRATFPIGTTGIQLDPLARMHLWEAGLNYGHGTGHGVGFFLNVHEGPQGFTGMSSARGREPLQVGMITSNEPGYYKEGEYGIRVENLMVTVASQHEGFLEFDTVTLYPIDLKLIDEAIFTKSEKAWLNSYHYKVLKQIRPYLEGDVKSWFELKCRPMN